jgi:hypothetical protein
LSSNYADINDRFMQECRKRNKRPADLSPEEAREIAVYVRTSWENLRDLAKRETSKALTGPFGVRVSLQQYQVRKSGCEPCDRFVILNGLPFCLVCQCGGSDLESKWQNPFAECPKNPPVWGAVI